MSGAYENAQKELEHEIEWSESAKKFTSLMLLLIWFTD